MSFDYLKAVECEGYLLVSLRVNETNPPSKSVYTRQALKKRITDAGFVPLFPGWLARPVVDQVEHLMLRAELTEGGYTTPAEMTFLYINKEDFLMAKTIMVRKDNGLCIGHSGIKKRAGRPKRSDTAA